METRNIGINVEKPKQECQDGKCPFHGQLTVHGRIFTGTVVSDKMHKTVTIEWERRQFIPKFERYEKRRTKLKAHNPSCVNAKEGDIVTIGETRPLSKTKHFVVLERKEGAHKALDVEKEMPEYAGVGKKEEEQKRSKAADKKKEKAKKEADAGDGQ